MAFVAIKGKYETKKILCICNKKYCSRKACTGLNATHGYAFDLGF